MTRKVSEGGSGKGLLSQETRKLNQKESGGGAGEGEGQGKGRGRQHRGRRDSIYWKLNNKATITFYPHETSYVLLHTEQQKDREIKAGRTELCP